MPTENRSSNTEQMVSARVCAYTPGQSKVELQLIPPSALPSWLELGQQVIARPAAQHQGTPVAYLVTDVHGQKKALAGAEGIERHRHSGSTLVPLYTHADAGEVERLQSQLIDSRDDLRAAISRNQSLMRRLDERDQLLQRCLMSVREQHCDEGEADFDLPANLMTEIDAALSASAEPSAPKCKHAACKSLGEHHPFCDFVQAIESSAPVERDQGIPGTSFQRLNMLANQGE
ncbi:hypothetical protein JYG36_13495 [Pseudomonas sp. SORT22]|uniref:hypothetical protein n=1 Tax=Pseudomonas sp. SORT22 TaxID=2813842 RepID=UPI001BCFBFE3|nr:hypothetical protein [Pseudomonas sp. SORT22]QVM94141.1 hypothetical protein JYG36_13495 [Pseudomonas sp. SORT22]